MPHEYLSHGGQYAVPRIRMLLARDLSASDAPGDVCFVCLEARGFRGSTPWLINKLAGDLYVCGTQRSIPATH